MRCYSTPDLYPTTIARPAEARALRAIAWGVPSVEHRGSSAAAPLAPREVRIGRAPHVREAAAAVTPTSARSLSKPRPRAKQGSGNEFPRSTPRYGRSVTQPNAVKGNGAPRSPYRARPTRSLS
jgi:hypothetical protein